MPSKPLNICIISAVFPPEPLVSARISMDLANFLDQKGHSITVVCPQPSRPIHANYCRYTRDTVDIETQGNLRIVRLPSYCSPQSRLLSRMYESYSFGAHAVRFMRRFCNPFDVLYVNAWPLLAQAQIVHYAKKHNTPVVLQIMDIYPESIIYKIPSILRQSVYSILLRLDTWISDNSSTLVVISENMSNSYIEKRKVRPSRLFIVPTWQDETPFLLNPDRCKACARYGISSELFTFMYLGNIGPVAGVDFLIQSFIHAQPPGSQMLIVGDGADREKCVNLASSLNASNIHFISDPDAASVPSLQSMADVFLLPMKKGTAHSSIPSKLQAYMFSAKPILATLDSKSDTASIIEKSNCGWIGEPEDFQGMAEKMSEAIRMPRDRLYKLGANGASYARAHFSKTKNVACLGDIVISAVHSI